MNIQNKIKTKLTDTTGQALLLIFLVSVICLSIVLGAVERSNRQLTIQRLNSDYNNAFLNAQGQVNGLMALIDSGDITPSDTAATIQNKLSTSNITFTLSGSANLVVDTTSLDSNTPFPLISDTGLVVVPQFQNVTASTVTVWCDTSQPNSAVVFQYVYTSGFTTLSDNIITTCKETGGLINGGSNMNAGTNINNSGFSVTFGTPTTLLVSGVSTAFQPITYTIPAAKNTIQSVRVIPKIGFNSAAQNTAVMVKIYDATAKVIGSSAPLTGTSTGIGASGRTSTLRFTLPNTAQLPSFFNYVLFEGQ